MDKYKKGGRIVKKIIPGCEILGVRIAAVNMKTVLSFIKENLRELQGQYICVSNVHTTVMSYENKKYQRIQKKITGPGFKQHKKNNQTAYHNHHTGLFSSPALPDNTRSFAALFHLQLKTKQKTKIITIAYVIK